MNEPGPYISLKAVNSILKETPPSCYHCGASYIKDIKLCNVMFNVWRPECSCILKPVRIVTGGPVIIEKVDVDDREEDS
jgi:hypothetical protein